jgi:phosphate transport system substrate-binding protein
MAMKIEPNLLERKMKRIISSVASAALLTAGMMAANTAWSAQKLDKNLPTYKKAAGVSGNLSSVGSDTLANLMTLWAEEFKRVYPNVNVQIQAAGSSTAPPALT